VIALFFSAYVGVGFCCPVSGVSPFGRTGFVFVLLGGFVLPVPLC
jgi:hypothetical protein